MKSAALRIAREHGVAVECADLGDWAGAELRSEYDPEGPTIRINMRILEKLPLEEMGIFITLAIGHELYHHREHCGQITKLHDRRAREAAADCFARELLAGAGRPASK